MREAHRVHTGKGETVENATSLQHRFRHLMNVHQTEQSFQSFVDLELYIRDCGSNSVKTSIPLKLF